MKEATKILDGPAYDDLLVERHMEGLCPYAVCGNAAATPYRSEEEQAADAKRVKVRMMANGLFEAPGGQGKSAYCSVRCKARSEWYRGILGRDGEGEMLEDVEERRKDVARSTREILEEAAKEQEAGVVKSASESTAEATPPPSSKAASFANDLLSSLSIREKPTSAVPPSAPTLDSAKYDFERPSAASASSATRFPSSPAPRAGSSISLPSSGAALLPFNTASLTRTVLRATSSQPLPPSRQLTRGVNGLPPIRFASNPRMLDRQGREVEWVGVDEEGETDKVREMMEEALMIKRMIKKGELSRSLFLGLVERFKANSPSSGSHD
ncbi:hypothetical protein JCM11641_006168 [Rhodosporidiobolus odoratus]